MTSRAGYFTSAAAAASGLLFLAACATPPAVVPTQADVRGLKPSGAIEMSQVFISATGLGSGTLTFRGQNHPFTILGSLNGLGALSSIQGAGEVYNLRDLAEFGGAYVQGATPVSLGAAPGEIWLKNTYGVIIRLRGVQSGVTVSSGRYQIYIQLGG